MLAIISLDNIDTNAMVLRVRSTNWKQLPNQVTNVIYLAILFFFLNLFIYSFNIRDFVYGVFFLIGV